MRFLTLSRLKASLESTLVLILVPDLVPTVMANTILILITLLSEEIRTPLIEGDEAAQEKFSLFSYLLLG